MEKLMEKIKKAWAFLAYILTLEIDISRPYDDPFDPYDPFDSFGSSNYDIIFDRNPFDDYETPCCYLHRNDPCDHFYSDYHNGILYSSDYSFHSDSSYRYDD
jgi:hypothetical protein